MNHLSSLGLTVQIVPYPSAEQHEHTIYRVIRAKQKKQVNDYGSLVTTVYDHILYIRNLDVPVRHRGKGIARALLQFGLLDQMKNPNLTVSELDDHSDRPWDGPGNLYYSFGYRFKPDNLEEKTLDLQTYKRSQGINLC
jgi:predicted GNAT family acetyltransferase